MTRKSRIAVAILVLLAIATGSGLVAFAASRCPLELPGQPCPDAGLNQAIVVGMAALAVGWVGAAFAFLAEAALRRGVVYRGAWLRAARRGVLVAVLVAMLGGLRLGGALSPAGALFVLVLAVAIEWFAVRWFDRP